MADDSQTEDDSQKTEEPTPKRLKEMREKGQVVLSREINNWVMLFVGTLIVGLLSPIFIAEIYTVMKLFIASPHSLLVDPIGFKNIMTQTIIQIALALFLPILLLIIGAIAAPFVQTGPIFSAETIKPKLEKISPLKGITRIFSIRALVEFLKGIVKIILVGIVIGFILWPYLIESVSYVGRDLPSTMAKTLDLFLQVMIGVLAVLFVLAVLDYLYQRFEHMKKARMSLREIKEEYKQSEGDPHIKSRLRQLRQERARQRMMAAVPNADVVITNPTHYAVALQYEPDEMNAPKMVAKGHDEIALRIRDVAKENNVYIMENPPLARALYGAMDIDQEIPSEHYKAVAGIISYVFKLKNKKL